MIKVLANITGYSGVSPLAITRLTKLAARHEPHITGTVEVNIVSDTVIKDLNRRYRGIPRPTDVLSFAWQEASFMPAQRKGPNMLGQLYLSYRYIARQAKRFKVSAAEEFVRMLAHGLLHLAGHDHTTAREAEAMFLLQEAIVASARRTGLLSNRT